MAWEYECLFDAEMTASQEPRLWSVLPSDIKVGSMGYRRRKTKAGPRLEVEIFPAFGRERAQVAREAKRNQTPEAMRRYNAERARRRIIQLADANFTEKDISLTLTYIGDPPSYEQAQKDIRNFLNRVKRLRRRNGMPETKYLYSIEGDEYGRKKRIHAHMLLSGPGEKMSLGDYRTELEKMWQRGYANADRLQPDTSGLEAIARYISKQESAKNRKKWCGSRNLKKPIEDKRDCKISNARTKILAYDFRSEAKEIMEKLYPSYQFVRCEVKYSDIVDGVYIRCLMRKRR